jgi:aminoglycoside 2'-N-acetyltransferase I
VADQIAVRRIASAELAPVELAQLLDLFAAAWPVAAFTPDDVDHAMGGVHWAAEAGRRIVAHASVVERLLEADGRPMRTGYVEAAGEHIRAEFELGALSTAVHRLYERHGWERWHGPTFVRTDGGLVRTRDEDGGIMVLRTSRTPPLGLTEGLSCEWRAGDAW